MKKFIVAALSVLVCGCACNFDSSLTTRDLHDGYQAQNLSNGLLSFDVMPQLNAMIVNMQYVPEKRPLMKPFALELEKDDLLPPVVHIKGSGIKDFLWRVTTFGLIPTKITERCNSPEKSYISMNDRFYRMQNCEYDKTVSLKKNSTAFQVKIRLTNHDKKTFRAAIWQNVIQELGEYPAIDTIVIPAKGGTRLVDARGVKFFEKDTVFQEKDLNDREVFVAPARPWIAARHENRNGVLALLTDEKSSSAGALFYTYKVIGTHTMEFIAAPRSMAKGQSTEFNFDYIFFPGLKNVSEVFKVNDIPVAVHADVKNRRQTVLTMQSSGMLPPATWAITLTGTDGKKYFIGNWEIANANPLKTFSTTLVFRSTIPPGEYKLSAVSEIGKFSLLETFKL